MNRHPVSDEQLVAALRRLEAPVTPRPKFSDELYEVLRSELRPRHGLKLTLLAAAALLVMASASAAFVGSQMLRPVNERTAIDVPATTPQPRSYEAVILRLEVLDGAHEVVVVGINSEGREREIARLPDASIVYETEQPRGAVSPRGLLAITSDRDGDYMMEWEVFDLRRPDPNPVPVDGIPGQFIETIGASPSWHTVAGRGGVFWGPADQAAIAWHKCEPVQDGCGVDPQLAFVDGRTGFATSVEIPTGVDLLPSWASDGSGVVVDSDRTSAGMSGRILRPNGVVADVAVLDAVTNCRTQDETGAVITVSEDGTVQRDLPPDPEQFNPFRTAYACLSPDASMIAHSIAREGFGESVWTHTGLIDAETEGQVAIEGSFAGWLEVLP